MTTTTVPQDKEAIDNVVSPRTQALALDVVSDLICPWCYIAKARLTQAMDELAWSGIDVDVTWRAFELNPDMPTKGMDRKDYRTHKFGSWSRSQAMDDQVAQVGKAEGLDFNYERVFRTPNTRMSHRLVHRSLHEGGHELQNAVIEGLFKAYFTTGVDVGSPVRLIEIACACGMDNRGLHEYLKSNEDESAVVHEQSLVARAGLQGVPSVLSGDQLLFSGAQPVEYVVETLKSAYRHHASLGESDNTSPGTRSMRTGNASQSIFS